MFKIYFKMYTSLYRCDILEITECREVFIDTLSKELPDLMRHDFLSKSQAKSFTSKKDNVKNGEFVVGLDFAQNHTFTVQNAIQAHHWVNTQATLHPYVVYYSENGKTKHLNYVIISDKTTHDTASVHLFNSKLIKHLKDKFGPNNVKKIDYYSDGAGSQYKNKFNFINLAHHRKDFGVDAEWHFFATSHGKGACDGLGGTIKRQARRTSLQRIDGNHITTPHSLFLWAKTFYKNISFDFCTQSEHDKHEATLKSRFEQAESIKDTRSYHCYRPLNQQKIACKLFSDAPSDMSVTCFINKKTKKAKTHRKMSLKK